MPSFSSKCSAIASALALASLPSDEILRDAKIEHPDFKTSSGHIRRTVNGAICHGVDWDGAPGIDSILREQGRRSGPLWREFRAWHHETKDKSLRESGDKACALLLKHFGPYHEATSEALRLRRSLQRERMEISRKLDAEFSPPLRRAAREYLSPQFAYALKLPSPNSFIAASIPVPETPLNPETSPIVEENDSPHLTSYTRSMMVLHEHVLKKSLLPTVTDLEHAAKEIITQIEPIENAIDLLDVRLSITALPHIPGEEFPADMDRLAYGSLICRHRAIIVGLLLADVGYDVRLVEGTIARNSLPGGGHLFLYSPTEGILEPSCDGPLFWQAVSSESRKDGKIETQVAGDLTYTFKRQIPLLDPR